MNGIKHAHHVKAEMGYGFNISSNPRTAYKPDNPLSDAFEKWLSRTPKKELDYTNDEEEPHYERALDIIGQLPEMEKISSNDIQTVLLPYQNDPRIRNTGLFLSACYNLSERPLLVWDLEIDERIDWIGYKLDRRKGLLLKADSRMDRCHQGSSLCLQDH